MTRETFDIFFGKIIEPLANDLCANASMLEFVPSSASGVYKEYTKQKSLFKQVYMKKNDTGLLDRHKVAACMAISIIKNNVVVSKSGFDDDFEWGDLEWANEHLAFSVGLSIVRGYILEAATNDNDEKKLEAFSNNFLFANVNHGEYPANIVRALFYSDLLNTLSVPLLSQLFFDIEYIHELLYRLDSTENTPTKT